MAHDKIPDQWEAEAREIEFRIKGLEETLEKLRSRAAMCREWAAARRANPPR
jgi:predicted ATP-grasp superfamily ATP-dependent carboligase